MTAKWMVYTGISCYLYKYAKVWTFNLVLIPNPWQVTLTPLRNISHMVRCSVLNCKRERKYVWNKLNQRFLNNQRKYFYFVMMYFSHLLSNNFNDEWIFLGTKEGLGFGSFHYQVPGQYFSCFNRNVLLDMKSENLHRKLICSGAVTDLNVRLPGSKHRYWNSKVGIWCHTYALCTYLLPSCSPSLH